jgi:putative FmdB family regulatory protein
MPVYEYVCQDCRRRFSWLVGVVAGTKEPTCPKCGSARLKKLVSRVASIRSEEETFERLEDEAADLEGAESPQAARRFARRMGDEFGDEMGEGLENEMESALEEDEESSESEEDEEY